MNTEMLKKDIARAIDLAQSVHDDMVAEFTTDNVPSWIMIKALEITGRLATLSWYLEHISSGLPA